MIGIPHEEKYRGHHIRLVSGIRCFVDGLLVHDETSTDDDDEIFSAEEVCLQARKIVDRLEDRHQLVNRCCRICVSYQKKSDQLTVGRCQHSLNKVGKKGLSVSENDRCDYYEFKTEQVKEVVK